MKSRLLVLGAGFGGLELTTILSDVLGDAIDITLIDRADAFIFGFAKLDVMFGHATFESVRHPYRDVAKPGVRFRQETVTAIDAHARRVATELGTYEADILVIALGAEYDATPGITLGEHEFYTPAGAVHLRGVLPSFTRGHAVIGVCGAPYKCPPAPSECALMLHDYLAGRGLRSACTITLVLPLPSPVPPSPDTSRALIAAFAERDIQFLPSRRVVAYERNVAVLDDGRELPCELMLGVPKHRAADVVVASGLTEGGWVSVDPRTLETRFPDVYAIGDLANTGAPKAGVFAEGTAKTVAANVLAKLRGETPSARYPGAGQCYVEFGAGRVARVDVDFFSGPKPTGSFQQPSQALRAEKHEFGASRVRRWFGR
jgi:sulfide:quinone oxidoreductase